MRNAPQGLIDSRRELTTRGVARCSSPCSIPSPPSVVQPPAGRCAGATGNEILRRSLRRQPKRIHPWRPRISPTAKGCIPCGAAEMREGSGVGNKRATDGTESSRTPDESQPAIEPNPEPRRAPPNSRHGLRNRRSQVRNLSGALTNSHETASPCGRGGVRSSHHLEAESEDSAPVRDKTIAQLSRGFQN
jgi:hypothetical protein